MSDISTLVILNKLIDWYEANKPSAGKRIQIDMGPVKVANMVGHFFEIGRDGKQIITLEIPYRNRILVAIGKD